MKRKGFTLIELMIVIVIIAILATMAIPSYLSYIRKSRRSESISTLSRLELEEEKYRVTHTTYGNINAINGGTTTTDNRYYTLSITGNTATAYTLTATAVNDQANDVQEGTSCTPMVITVNNYSETKSPVVCWR